jgi:hypothetical protein
VGKKNSEAQTEEMRKKYSNKKLKNETKIA